MSRESVETAFRYLMPVVARGRRSRTVTPPVLSSNGWTAEYEIDGKTYGLRFVDGRLLSSLDAVDCSEDVSFAALAMAKAVLTLLKDKDY